MEKSPGLSRGGRVSLREGVAEAEAERERERERERMCVCVFQISQFIVRATLDDAPRGLK